MAAAAGQLKPGILPYQEILELCGLGGNEDDESTGQGPIQPCRRKNVRSASYDLRLGPEYHFTDGSSKKGGRIRKMRVSSLTASRDEHIVLPPNQVVVVSCLEKICMPNDMVGHLTLKQDILLEGLIMASQSQIDAGYRGWIYPLLYNLTDREVELQLNQSVIRLELVRLAVASDNAYHGDYQESTLSESLKRPIASSLASLNERVRNMRSQINRTRFFAAAGAVVLAIIPFATGFIGDVYNTRDRVSRLEGELHGPLKHEGAREVNHLRAQLANLQCRILERRGQLKPGRC